MWSGVNRLGFLFVNAGTGSSAMTILSGNNTSVSTATGNVKIIGAQIDSFQASAGCMIMNMHGAGVAVPP
jgi:hypothetical protein